MTKNSIVMEIIDNVIIIHYNDSDVGSDNERDNNTNDKSRVLNDKERDKLCDDAGPDFYPNGEPRTHKGYLKSVGVLK